MNEMIKTNNLEAKTFQFRCYDSSEADEDRNERFIT